LRKRGYISLAGHGPGVYFKDFRIKELKSKAKQVLYVTHEPGRWHKYGPQKEFFKKIGTRAKWDVTVKTGSHDDQIAWLKTKDYGVGYDAIVYNFCFANSKDLEACHNLMAQTRENGVPAMLIHCAMHSWWVTFKHGKDTIPDYKGKAKSFKAEIDKWTKAHPDTPYPVWGDFTGIASVAHGPHQPITFKKLKEHPATRRLSDGFTTKNTELYNNYYINDNVIPLIEGQQGNSKAIIMWEVPQGKSRVIGLSVGHGVADWEFEEFQNLIMDGINYMVPKRARKKSRAKNF